MWLFDKNRRKLINSENLLDVRIESDEEKCEIVASGRGSKYYLGSFNNPEEAERNLEFLAELLQAHKILEDRALKEVI